MKLRHQSGGFTLIELLVVISIIALLAALLFPVFGRAREKARQSSCGSNIKQLNLGITLYLQDYDETFPGRIMPVANEDLPITWRVLINSYMKSVQLLRCSSNRYNQEMTQEPPGAIFYKSYGVNGNDNGGDITEGALNGFSLAPMPAKGGVSLASIYSPAQCILITESNEDYTELPGDFDTTVRPSLFAGHSGRANVGFVDTHIKALKPTSTALPVNMWDINQGPPNLQKLLPFLEATERFYR